MLATFLGGRAVSFLMGPAGKIGLLALAFTGWTMYQRVDATLDCEADHLREQLTEANRQLDIAQRIAVAARGRADQSEVEMAQIKRELDAFIADQADRETAGSCDLSPADIERLRAIR